MSPLSVQELQQVLGPTGVELAALNPIPQGSQTGLKKENFLITNRRLVQCGKFFITSSESVLQN